MQFSVQFGCDVSRVVENDQSVVVELAVPVLFGQSKAVLFEGSDGSLKKQGALTWVENDQIQVGCMALNEGSLETRAQNIYDAILSASEGYNLIRAWNYVPDINNEKTGLENYRQFCVGRANAFLNSGKPMSAASAVGIDDETLVVYYLCCKSPVKHLENPEQVPAYNYPTQYGPKSPSFSRGSVSESKNFSGVFISGTAAIKGHKSLHPGDLDLQLETTLDNLYLMVSALGQTHPTPFMDETTIYLRSDSDLEMFKMLLEKQSLLERTSRILRADICRKELLVEIETHGF